MTTPVRWVAVLLLIMSMVLHAMSASLSKLQPADVDKLSVTSIPRIIHQTWKTAERPDWDVSVSTCLPMHEGHEVMLHTDAGMDEFIRTNYPQYYQMYTDKFIAIQVRASVLMLIAWD